MQALTSRRRWLIEETSQSRFVSDGLGPPPPPLSTPQPPHPHTKEKSSSYLTGRGSWENYLVSYNKTGEDQCLWMQQCEWCFVCAQHYRSAKYGTADFYPLPHCFGTSLTPWCIVCVMEAFPASDKEKDWLLFNRDTFCLTGFLVLLPPPSSNPHSLRFQSPQKSNCCCYFVHSCLFIS